MACTDLERFAFRCITSPSSWAHWGRYVASQGHQSLPSLSMEEGQGRGEDEATIPHPRLPPPGRKDEKTWYLPL
jgi:hypothetical protein